APHNTMIRPAALWTMTARPVHLRTSWLRSGCRRADGGDDPTHLGDHQTGLLMRDVMTAVGREDVRGTGFHRGQLVLQAPPEPLLRVVERAGPEMQGAAGENGQRHAVQRMRGERGPRLRLGAADVHLL